MSVLTAAKLASTSRVEMTQLVLPSYANSLGNAFGGRVMQWIDLAAAIAAMRHTRMPVVTASIDQLVFRAPIRVSQIAILRAQVNAVFGSSLEIEVTVDAARRGGGRAARRADRRQAEEVSAGRTWAHPRRAAAKTPGSLRQCPSSSSAESRAPRRCAE